MHELSIAERLIGLLEKTAAQEQVSKITGVRIEIGVLAGIVVESLIFCIEIVARGTRAEGATVEVIRVTGKGTCRTCGFAFEVNDYAQPCPGCDGYRIDVQGGTELRILDMEVS